MKTNLKQAEKLKHEACRDMVAAAPAPIERALPVDEHSAVLGNSEAALATAPEAAPESEAAQPATPDQAIPDGMMLLEIAAYNELVEERNAIADDLKCTLADNEMMGRVFDADDRLAAMMTEAKRQKAIADVAISTMNAKNGEYIERARAVTHWKNRAKKAEKALAKLAA